MYPTRVDTELVARMRALEAVGPRTPIIAPICRNSYSQAPVPPQSTAGGICASRSGRLTVLMQAGEQESSQAADLGIGPQGFGSNHAASRSAAAQPRWFTKRIQAATAALLRTFCLRATLGLRQRMTKDAIPLTRLRR